MEPWAGFELGTDGLRAQYCELNRLESWIRQPANTVSNLAYFVAGVGVFSDRGRAGHLRGPLRTVVGISLLLLAVGSALFHSSITLHAQRFDMGGTYAVVLSLVGASLALLRPGTEHPRWAAGVLVVTGLFVVFDLFRYGTVLLPLLLFAALVSTGVVWWRRREAHRGGDLGIAGGALLFAAVCWFLDLFKVGCSPRSPWQWHATWHCATAAAAYCTYRFLDRPGGGAP